MQSLRALRFRVVLIAVIALLHASSPLHVHSHGADESEGEWTEVCTGSGQIVRMRVDAATGEAVTASGDSRSSAQTPDQQCAHCLTSGGSAPAAAGPTQLAAATADRVPAQVPASSGQPTWPPHQPRAPPALP